MFTKFYRQILILKNDGKWSFSFETEDQYHLCQWGECVYGALSWKEIRLLRESMIIPIDEWTFILKNGAKWSSS